MKITSGRLTSAMHTDAFMLAGLRREPRAGEPAWGAALGDAMKRCRQGCPVSPTRFGCGRRWFWAPAWPADGRMPAGALRRHRAVLARGRMAGCSTPVRRRRPLYGPTARCLSGSAPRSRQVVAAPKVSGPTYYDYKADPLVQRRLRSAARSARKGHVRAVARRPVAHRSGRRPGRFRPVRRKGRRQGAVRLLFGQSAIHLGDRQQRQCQGRSGDPPARSGRQLWAVAGRLCRRSFRPLPSTAAMPARAWRSWCASR